MVRDFRRRCRKTTLAIRAGHMRTGCRDHRVAREHRRALKRNVEENGTSRGGGSRPAVPCPRAPPLAFDNCHYHSLSVERLPGTVPLRGISPGASAGENPEDADDHPAVIYSSPCSSPAASADSVSDHPRSFACHSYDRSGPLLAQTYRQRPAISTIVSLEGGQVAH